MEELRCIGCGSIIQTNDPKKAGYVPESKLNEDENSDFICRRCFRLKHYNEVTPLEITQEDFYKVVSEIGQQNALVVKIIDIFDIEGSMIPQISKLTNHNDMIILANKVDLLPKSVKEAKLLHHIKRICKEYNLKPLEIHLMSAIKYKNLDDIVESVMKHANHRDVYIVGATNVGKSTFINRLLRSYADVDTDLITVSGSAGTTLDMIKIPVGDQFIIDTPGIINPIQMVHYVSPETNKRLMPKKEIKPRGYQLEVSQTLFIGGLVRLDYVEGDNTSFICYVSDHMPIHRTKRENADQVWHKHKGKLLSPPNEDELFDLVPRMVHVPPGKYDIVLPGIGFVTVKDPSKVIVHTHKKVTPYIREALI